MILAPFVLTKGKQKIIFLSVISLATSWYLLVYTSCEDQYSKFVTLRMIVNKSTKNEENDTGKMEGGRYRVRVLIWSSFYGKRNNDTGSEVWKHLDLDHLPCERKYCQVFNSRILVNESDAVVFHGWFADTTGLAADLPPRNREQPWVYWMRESPDPPDRIGREFENFTGINWTMTYRRDSDVYNPYGEARRFNENSSEGDEYSSILPKWHVEVPLTGKSKFAVAVISNCVAASKRMQVINMLKEYGLPVDMYGKKCGINPDPDEIRGGSFWNGIQKQYQFYLAFENSLCVDYITEKFWRSLRLGILPVVYGGGNYSAVAPPHSYIDVRDYNTIEELVSYLLQLAHDPVSYGKYFEWRRNYRVIDQEVGFCNLCDRIRELRTGKRQPGNRTNIDVYRWYMSSRSGAVTIDGVGDYSSPFSMAISACHKLENEPFWKKETERWKRKGISRHSLI